MARFLSIIFIDIDHTLLESVSQCLRLEFEDTHTLTVPEPSFLFFPLLKIIGKQSLSLKALTNFGFST